MARRSHFRHLVALALTALSVAACTSSTTSTAPSASPSRCDVAVTNTLESAPAAGAGGTLNVSTDRDCTWAVSVDSGWVTILTGSSGQGSGSSSYRVAANTEPATRRATLSVNERTVVVTQEAACRYVVTPATLNAAAGGLTAEVSVDAGGSCEWTATADADWVRVRGGGPGAGVVAVEIAANTAGPRTARLVVAGQSVTIAQAGVTVAPCTYAIDPVGQTVPPAGGPIDVAVTTGPACAWSATSNADWITIARNPSGTGPATVTLSVSSNPTASRSGTATIAGLTFTVTQSPVPCAFALNATSTSVAAAGGTGSVGLTTSAGCGWVAGSNAPWLSITAGAAGTGNGSVAFTAAANTGAARTGTLTIAGLVFTVSQAAAPAPPPPPPPPPPSCSYSLNPLTQTVGRNGGRYDVSVVTTAGCEWTAVVEAAARTWVSITAGASGVGSGKVTYEVERNRTADRMGTIQVATQTLTITQPD